MSGFTLSYRDKWENPVFRNLLEAGIWAWMCDTAVWKDTTIRFSGKLIFLKRGQLVTSERFISEGFGIGRQIVRSLFSNLLLTQMITREITQSITVITICNYDKYQGSENINNPPNNPDLTHHPTKCQPSANPNKKEDKEKKERTRAKITLEDLSVKHVDEWLKKKRSEGKYLNYDEENVLEVFKNYCYAKKPAYKDFVAAFRNAFEWDSFRKKFEQSQPKPANNPINQPQITGEGWC